MGHINEPYGIDFVVESKPLSDVERVQISEIIAHYKATGRKSKLPTAASFKSVLQKRVQNKKGSVQKQSTKV